MSIEIAAEFGREEDYVDDYEALYQAEFGNRDHGFCDYRDYHDFHDFLETQCDDYYPSIPSRTTWHLSNTHAEEDQDIVMMECDQYEEEKKEEEEEEWDQEVSPEEEENQEAIRYQEQYDISKYLVTNTYTVAKSDIDIVSSDGIVFKAHTVILRQASLLHQSFLPPSLSYLGYEAIKLPDDDTGHSSVLAIYLQLIYPATRPDMYLANGLLNRRVIRLARDWKSLLALDRISKEVFLGALSGFSQANPPTLFITAVGLQDPTLLGFIVSQTGQLPWVYAWSDRDRKYFTERGTVMYHRSEVAHQHHYNFGCWPLEHYNSIPPHVVYATSELIGTTDEEVDYRSVGRELKARLLQAHGSGNSWTDIILRDGIDMPLCRTTMDRIRHIQQYDRLGAGAEDFLFEERWWSQDIQSLPTEIQASVFTHGCTNSDVMMVCSDGPLVRTHSHILAKASPAFSGMVGLRAQIDPSTVTEGPLSLGDEMSAHSTVVKALMDVLYRSELPDLRFSNLLRHLIVLADKWGIEKVPEIIKKALSVPESSARNFDRFLLAIGLEDYALAAKIMGQVDMDRQCYEISLDEFPPVELHDRSILDSALEYRNYGYKHYMHSSGMYGLASCQYLDFIRLPPRVAWALQRAAVMWEHGVDDGRMRGNKTLDWDQREITGERFRRIMMPDYLGAALLGECDQLVKPLGRRWGSALNAREVLSDWVDDVNGSDEDTEHSRTTSMMLCFILLEAVACMKVDRLDWTQSG